jgi:hypothetical protein
MPGGNRQEADKDVPTTRRTRMGQEQALACHWQDADTEVDIARTRRKRIRAMSFWGCRVAASITGRG